MALIDLKTYIVKRVKETPDLKETKVNASFFDGADALSDFSYPWERDVNAPPLIFKAVHDNQWLHFLFCVKDFNIKIHVDKNEKEEVVHGDRVEIFFSKDEALSSYYCLEIDPLGRVYDYHASHYRKFDSRWHWPKGHLGVRAEYYETGYNVSGMISIHSLEDYGLLKNKNIHCGLYRGKCLEVNLKNEKMKWISWVSPDSVTPDFHIPSSFGTFQFE